MEQASEAKSARMLDIYARLMAGQVLNKTALAEEYGVTLRSIQRDMESLRFFLMEKGLPQEVIYDRAMKGYRMVNSVPSGLSNSEILAVCKILLESRSIGILQGEVLYGLIIQALKYLVQAAKSHMHCGNSFIIFLC